ncbi:hypothetical protein K2173_024970 [Erythroxylum novogranatense]|uniref:Uncharacterized protein n=1 Tax=Erythroxylum novogranatense TaxID=1862640 RepID=A0AAV8UCW2_9ROSI|nr:hypothetical protein K2173_024970 [Erythroxylum novogranatense]
MKVVSIFVFMRRYCVSDSIASQVIIDFPNIVNIENTQGQYGPEKVEETQRQSNPSTEHLAMNPPTTVKPPHQPLHNFTFQGLNWSKNNSGNHHRVRKHLGESSHQSTAKELGVDRKNEGLEMKSVDGQVDKKSKLFIWLGAKRNGDGEAASDENKTWNVEGSTAAEHKVWNLRPRGLVTKKKSSADANASRGARRSAKKRVSRGGGAEMNVRFERNDGSELAGDGAKVSENKNEKGKGKVKTVYFSISLTKQEIAEDIYSLTGSKPSRKPKKRIKLVQKQLDCLFPGMWLSSATSDTYKVHESHHKEIKGLRI